MAKLIRIKDETYNKLSNFGKWSDTMDAIIIRLLDQSNDNKVLKKLMDDV